MKSWIFSCNDQTTQPLSGEEAMQYVANNPTAYAWRPSYTHWMPVTYIAEFANIIKAPKAPSTVPKELIEQFITKEKALVENLSTLDGKIINAINALSEFESEVEYYKELTRNCNLDVQETLNSIEQQYARLKANLQNFTQNAASDKKAFAQTVEQFKNVSTGGEALTPKKSPEVQEAQAVTPPTVAPAQPVVEDVQVSATPEPLVAKPEPVVNETVVSETVADEDVILEPIVTEQAPAISKESVLKEPVSKELDSEKQVLEEPSVSITESDSFSIEDESLPAVEAETTTGPIVERVVKKPDAVASPQASRAAASLSEQVESIAPEPSYSQPAPKQISRVEFSEDITAEDLAIAAKIQSMTIDEDTPQSYESPAHATGTEGDFDYILKGKYVDDGSIGRRVDESVEDSDAISDQLEEEMVASYDDQPKRRRRRRRR
ncbi:hypothetical protein MHM98_08460 [Psychrobium sp. MM17-31]|uniref:hypothetical protein n=1 Tax=Psychrobium sp. MM17-31 TaxID=2917758 RepID=UPI001EF74943|nr:hypothetical protein [Psychrobium sp. MM17-31]MCG7531379.1 hypothetical protein [Psychrobium sp. MM17-31]